MPERGADAELSVEQRAEIAGLITEATRLRDDIEAHRRAISEVGALRRTVVDRLVQILGPTRAAKELGIARQTVYEILNPSVPRERKARLRKANT